MATKEELYDERISPLMVKIIALCKEHKINMAAQFSLGIDDNDDEQRTLFCTTALHDIDPDDEQGVERMTKLRAVMYPPAPRLFAFTIIEGAPR